MEVKQIVHRVSDQYPFCLRVAPAGHFFTTDEMENIDRWLKETGINGLLVRGAIYLPTEKEVNIFLLRWA